MHSGRGSQYGSKAITKTIKASGMRASMSCKGDCWNNAPTESLWGSLKVGPASWDAIRDPSRRNG